jgi:uncharacterized membrane protein
LKKISPYILSFVLAVAGVAHFVIPREFLKAMPPYFLYPLPLIYITGIVELVFAIFLLLKNRHRSLGRVIAVYFVILIPVHVHVSLNGIEMFGVADKALLWMRTLFQGFFIYWAYSLDDERASSHSPVDQL